jgi:hypothetical protein
MDNLSRVLNMAQHYHDSPATKDYYCTCWRICTCKNAIAIRSVLKFQIATYGGDTTIRKDSKI